MLGDLLPEVRKQAKWQIEYEFAMNWFQRSGNGLDARFVRALKLELDDARRFVAANGKLPPWAVEMSERRYFVEVTEAPEGGILRSEGGLGSETGKDAPKGRGARPDRSPCDRRNPQNLLCVLQSGNPGAGSCVPV